jgi:hypothetical protein
MNNRENNISETDYLFKLKAKQSLLTQIVELQVQISHGWGECIVQENSLDYSIRRVRHLCEEYVQLGLFSQEEMDEFWILINQSRYILRTRHAVENLAQDLEKNKLSIPDSTKSAIQDVVKNVSKFRYPKDGLLKVKTQEQGHD